MRNVARRGALTRFHLIADIENFFPKDISKNMEGIASYLIENKTVVIVRFVHFKFL